MLIIYFYVISFSIIGYGLAVSKILNINLNSIGYLGILGISSLAIISYTSSIFLAHQYIFNCVILILGAIFFLFFFKRIYNLKSELILFFLIFSILILFIIVGKNHDDFSYYHFPYISLLTDHSHFVGLGQLNNGFRNPSSIFFISSLFYLPKVEYHLFHLTPAFFLGFVNLILIRNIFDQNDFNKKKFINILSLIFFVFINIFFYRLSEHGTDRSGLILAICSFITLLCVINDNLEISKDKNISLIKFFSVSVCLLISLKPFYLIYTPLFLLLFFYKHSRNIFINLFFSKTFFFCISLIFFTIFYTFINSGCFIFPATLTCYENLSWSLPIQTIEDVRVWYELWAKAGANPNFIVDNRIEYINGFNWLNNWVDIYFFNKVLDYLLSLTFLFFVILFTFYNNNLLKNKNKREWLLVYSFIIICFLEWFINHPALRYGGYHLVALLLFLPLSIFLDKFEIKWNNFYKKALILIIISMIVFVGRNTFRIKKEYDSYGYNPLVSLNYLFIGGNKNFYFRYNENIKKNISKYEKIKILGKEITIIRIIE
jgi:hypothetical protein